MSCCGSSQTTAVDDMLFDVEKWQTRKRFGVAALLALLVSGAANAQKALPSDTAECPDVPTDVSYVFAAETPLREKPLEESAVVFTAEPAQYGQVLCVVPGWARVHMVKHGGARGWVFGLGSAPENLLLESWVDIALREVRFAEQKWPPALKVDILRKRVRPGFTGPQVEIALGKPHSRTSDETAAGTTEIWTYDDQVLTLRKGAVVSIRRAAR